MNCNNNQNNNNGCGCNCNPHPTPAPEPVDINMNVCDRNINMLPMLQTYTTKVLKPNIDGCCKKNILKQCMMNCENYKYVIKWDFDLNGETITVPENCILEFDGGSLKNGTIIGQDTVYINVGDVDIWGENLTREGTWREHSGGGGGSYSNEDAHLKSLTEITPDTLQAFFDQALSEKRDVDLDGMTLTVTRMISLNNKVLHENLWWWTIKNGTIICDANETHALFTADNDAVTTYPAYGQVVFDNIRFVNSTVEPNLTDIDMPWGFRSIYSPWCRDYRYYNPDPIGSYHPLTKKCKVLSGNRLIRMDFNDCHFDGIGAAETGVYLQSLRFERCRIQNLEHEFMKAYQAYDIHFINSYAEWCEETTIFDIQVPELLDISNSAIEYVRSAIKFCAGQSVSITNCYFEGCRDHVVEQYGGGVWETVGFAFTGNVCMQSYFDNVSDGGLGEYHYLHFDNILTNYCIQGNSFYVQSFDQPRFDPWRRPDYTVNDFKFAKGGNTGLLIENKLNEGLRCWKNERWYDADGFEYNTKKYGGSNERPFGSVKITDFPTVYKYIDTDNGIWKEYNPDTDASNTDNKYCTIVDVSEYRGKLIAVNTYSYLWGTFLTEEDHQVVGQNAAYCAGYSTNIKFNNGIGVPVPEDAKYLYLIIHSGQTNYALYSALVMQDELPNRHKAGAQYFDTGINKPIWFNGLGEAGKPYWVNADGFDVNTKKYGRSNERPFKGMVISPIEEIQKYINTDTGVWTNGDATHTCALINVNSMDGYFLEIISEHSEYCWITFLADTPVEGQSVEYIGSYIRYQFPTVMQVPERAKYLYILLKFGDVTYYINSVSVKSDVIPSDYEAGYRFFDTDLNKPLWFSGFGKKNPSDDSWVCADGIGSNIKRFGTTTERPFSVTKITTITALDYIMDGTTNVWVAGGGSYQSALVDVSAYRNRYLQIDCTHCYFSFFSAEPSLNHTVAFADGYTGGNVSDKPQKVLVPNDAAYLYIVLKTPTATYVVDGVNIITDFLPIDKQAGFQYFDTTINKPIWFSGNSFVGNDGWVDATGGDPDATNEPNG